MPTLIPQWKDTHESRVQCHQASEDQKGLRYCPAVLSANGRIKPDAVLVDGREEKHSEGAYYLEWREGAKRIRLSIGKDPAEANARRLIDVDKNGHRSLAAAVAEVQLPRRPEGVRGAMQGSRQRQLLASQVPRDVRNAVAVGWR
jgi:hypothetical protein